MDFLRSPFLWCLISTSFWIKPPEGLGLCLATCSLEEWGGGPQKLLYLSAVGGNSWLEPTLLQEPQRHMFVAEIWALWPGGRSLWAAMSFQFA